MLTLKQIAIHVLENVCQVKIYGIMLWRKNLKIYLVLKFHPSARFKANSYFDESFLYTKLCNLNFSLTFGVV